MPDDRLEGWPPSLHGILAVGLHRQLVAPRSGATWHFSEAQLDPFQPENGWLCHTLGLGLETAIVLVLRRPSDPNHLYELIGLRPPADGLGIAEYRPLDSGEDQALIVRRACAYTRGSMVIGEIQWDGERGGVDRLVNPLQSQPRRGRQEIANAMDGLRVLSNITKRVGGPTAMSDEDAFAEAVRFGREWQADNPEREIRELRAADLARRKCVTPKAYGQWMTDKHFGIKAIRAKIQELDGEK